MLLPLGDFHPGLLQFGLEYSLKAHACGKGLGPQLGTMEGGGRDLGERLGL